ncbi:MAG: hypothetical protein A2722_01570 [Candidatus Doudnabacteria bacterium RIFCSPHIGHO2_01_FULL_50_11]|uniref:Antitoxin n=1 Tax=Candidatus Doudnabacteria bacterium RIFCSPHIGHO2_01_FULL_50_11 TaxID=1817828 RepID=A0A1F5PMW6_9BACT|nr:MAG: hypothetical protein A2722_01570 [Candidatus Doudnabacteria bacterium RIFCSPHIGHO2_01_FULL_50_11]HLC44298.1 hypothetical protein [Patescibacteria group bacterium]
MDLEKFIKLTKSEKGPLVVLNAAGEPELVVMSYQAYENLKSDRRFEALSERLENLTRATEELNLEITRAQMDDDNDTGVPLEENEDEDSVYIEPLSLSE